MDKFIDKIFYINLESRKDRREQIEGELLKMDLSGERFNAIKHRLAYIGCSLSHLEILKIARERRYKNVLILEDDFEFILDKQTFENNMKEFFESNISYDLVMLAYNGTGDSILEKCLISKVVKAGTTAGYLVHNKIYDALIENYQDGIIKLLITNYYGDHAIDKHWYYLLKDREWYLFNTRIGKQRESYSDIENKVVNYGV
jgi:glycosyl transferase family 25